MKACTICNHDHREKIENILFKMGPKGSSVTLDKIAEEFEVAPSELQRHILFHTPYGSEEGSDSLIRRIKMHEVDLLGESAREYMTTLKEVGLRIRNYTRDIDENAMEKKLSKPTVDLYLGCGENVRTTVRAIADIDNLLNGPKDEGISGLLALTQAINASRQACESDD